MIKEIKNSFHILKELWKNRKTRALIMLSGYCILFTIVILVAQSQTPIETAPKNNYPKMNNYAYSVTVLKNKQPIITKQGKKYNTKEQFTLNNQEFYIQDKMIYQIINNQMHVYRYQEEIEELLSFLEPNNIEKLIQKGTEIYTKNYHNGITEKNYTLLVDHFIQIWKNETIESVSNVEIEITTTIENENLIKVELDLTNYFNQSQYEPKYDTITIEYQNINQILDWNIEYEWIEE